MNYPVKLSYEDNVYYVEVPDLSLASGVTYGESLEEALKNAKEVIVLELSDLESENKEFPKPSEFKELQKTLSKDEVLMMLDFNYDYEKSLIKKAYKKKTLSIPTWLDMLAVNRNINFSQLLQKALKEELNVK